MTGYHTPSAELCVQCKGTRHLCGLSVCPLLLKQMATLPIRRVPLTDEIDGSSPPSFFVGHHHYPRVLVGPMIPPIAADDINVYDEPDLWYGKSVQELIQYRTSLVRTTFSLNVRHVSAESKKFLSISQELVMAKKPVYTEAKLIKRPQFSIDFDSLNAPLGPSGKIKRLRPSDNPSILPIVDKMVGDTDLVSTSAIYRLYKEGLTVTQIQRLLSAGLLGVQKNRCLVPTRWSITATDDTISKALIEEIKVYPEIGEIQLFRSSYLDNHFFALLFPRSWMFEQLETWHSGSPWVQTDAKYVIIQDHELNNGRKKYASATAGAYYAARLAVAEYLTKIHRQAAALIFREIRPGYLFPLGVWQIRENLRNAFKAKPETVSDISEALTIIGQGMLTPMDEWLNISKIYDFITHQTTLTAFHH